MTSHIIGCPVEIRIGEELLCGTLHRPSGKPPRNGWPAALMCHGLTGTRIEAHYLFVKASRALAAAGIASLRFDFRGCGESSGRFQNMSILTELADATAALNFLRMSEGIDPERLGVLGISFGGSVAALLAGSQPDDVPGLKGVVLWNAVADPATRWAARLENLRDQAREPLRFPIEHHGHRIGRRFFRDLRRAPLPTSALAASDAPVLIIGSSPEAEHAQAYAHACGRNARLVILEGYDHTFARTDWETKVIGITKRWLAPRL